VTWAATRPRPESPPPPRPSLPAVAAPMMAVAGSSSRRHHLSGAAERSSTTPPASTSTATRRRIRLPPGWICDARSWGSRGRRRRPCGGASEGAQICVPLSGSSPPRSDRRRGHQLQLQRFPAAFGGRRRSSNLTVGRLLRAAPRDPRWVVRRHGGVV
jgi:hypothetical protein